MQAACTHAPPRNPMAQWVPSPNHEPRRPILIVLHATTQDRSPKACTPCSTGNSGGPVSAHYLIGRDGALYQLVSDEQRAWHAGPGRWGTITDVNSASIGIELDNNGEAAFPPQQIAALLRLLEDLCTRLDIPRTQVIAHADMAPTRKRDPGHLFPWRQLAEAGFGRWPDRLDRDRQPGFDRCSRCACSATWSTIPPRRRAPSTCTTAASTTTRCRWMRPTPGSCTRCRSRSSRADQGRAVRRFALNWCNVVRDPPRP